MNKYFIRVCMSICACWAGSIQTPQQNPQQTKETRGAVINPGYILGKPAVFTDKTLGTFGVNSDGRGYVLLNSDALQPVHLDGDLYYRDGKEESLTSAQINKVLKYLEQVEVMREDYDCRMRKLLRSRMDLLRISLIKSQIDSLRDKIVRLEEHMELNFADYDQTQGEITKYAKMLNISIYEAMRSFDEEIKRICTNRARLEDKIRTLEISLREKEKEFAEYIERIKQVDEEISKLQKELENIWKLH